ncbi:MAG: hypothetical protein KGI60_01080 [Patescibacteria group bacterium]|nr:hypothetical protein [Patescibacteria group bacterium]
MLFRFPKDDKNYAWTTHVKNKMLHYRISEQKVKTILGNPSRKEEGIAPDTSAVMKRNDTPKRKEELWVMYTRKAKISKGRGKTTIISTWRYPGISPKGKEIPIPEDILSELEKLL